MEHYYYRNPDVDPEEMKKSDSKSKYVHGKCNRWTYTLTLEKTEKENRIEKLLQYYLNYSIYRNLLPTVL